MVLLNIIVLLLPIIYLIGTGLKNIGSPKIASISNGMIIIFVIIMALTMGCFSIPELSDRANYRDLYMAVYKSRYYGEYKDIGWYVFVSLCTKVFQENYQLFFVLVSFIYCFSYYFFAKNQFEKKYVSYIIVMAFGCLGFSGYGTNTIRAGMALGVLLISLSFEGKKYLKLCLALLAISIHLSMAMPVSLFILSQFLKKDRLPYYMWLICFILSILNFDLSPYINGVSSDARLNYINMVTDSYNAGYRIDFLVYSIVPIIIVLFYKKQGFVLSEFYEQLYRTYLMSNAVWLLVIRMAYTNRVAYLSWMIIPYILLYPIVYNRYRIKNSKFIILFLMSLFMSVNITLSLRDFIGMR